MGGEEWAEPSDIALHREDEGVDEADRMTYFYSTTEGHLLLPPTILNPLDPTHNSGLDTVLRRWSVNTRPLTRQSQRFGGVRRKRIHGNGASLFVNCLSDRVVVDSPSPYNVADHSVETVDITVRGAI